MHAMKRATVLPSMSSSWMIVSTVESSMMASRTRAQCSTASARLKTGQVGFPRRASPAFRLKLRISSLARLILKRLISIPSACKSLASACLVTKSATLGALVSASRGMLVLSFFSFLFILKIENVCV